VALVASVAPERRSGFALGMMQAAVLVGFAMGPLLGGVVADHFGYRMTFRLGALVILTGGVLVHFGAREELNPVDSATDAVPAPGFRGILATSGFLVATLVLFSVRFSNTMANPSFPLVVRDILPASDNLNSVTGSAFAVAALGGAVAAGVLGHFGDSWGHKRILIGCSLAAAVASTAHAFAYSMPALYVARIFFGLSVAGMLPAANALIRAASDRRSIGKAYGAATSLSMAGIALGPLVGGYLVGTAGLRTPFIATGIAQLLVAVIVVCTVRNDSR
jgi:DHA1 family multidrug resistance protein-like MFS transporter